MAIIYRLRYDDDGSPAEQNFRYEQDARFRLKELANQERITNAQIYRQRIMRPTLKTILRILNDEPYVYEQKVIAGHDEQGEGRESLDS